MKHSPNTDKLVLEYARLCRRGNLEGSVLEVGCGPSKNTLLNRTIFKHSKYRVGINLIGYTHYREFKVIKCNAHDMKETFDENTFDIVLCNMVLEHDPLFWKSLEEINRVIKKGGLFVLGVPAVISNVNKSKLTIGTQVAKVNKNMLLNSTITYRVHNAPGDYWRFTEQAYKEVLMQGFEKIVCSSFLLPPLLLGSGIKQ